MTKEMFPSGHSAKALGQAMTMEGSSPVQGEAEPFKGSA